MLESDENVNEETPEGDVDEELAREAMRLAGHKLPIKTKFIMREGAGQQ